MNFKALLLICVILAFSTLGEAQGNLGKVHKSKHGFKGRFGGDKPKDGNPTQTVTLAKTNPREFAELYGWSLN